jgi:hypothetical protein
VAGPVWWIADFAARAGMRYEPEVDERWLRVWEPFVTLKTPIRYEHALHSTGTSAAISIARFVLAPRPGWTIGDEAWIAFVQDEAMTGPRAAATSDAGGIFGDTVTSLPRQFSRDPAFDSVFTSFAESEDALAKAVTPSLRKLTMGWRTPVHFEIKAGGFVLSPVALRPEPQSLAWLTSAARFFDEKAKKRSS